MYIYSSYQNRLTIYLINSILAIDCHRCKELSHFLSCRMPQYSVKFSFAIIRKKGVVPLTPPTPSFPPPPFPPPLSKIKINRHLIEM